MLKRTIFIAMILGLFPFMTAFSQTPGDESLASRSLNDFYIVAGAGAGGAVLGLSTLSFVDEPSDHSKNILIGGAIGVVIGVIVVVYLQATETTQNFDSSPLQSQLIREEAPTNPFFRPPAVAFQMPIARWRF